MNNENIRTLSSQFRLPPHRMYLYARMISNKLIEIISVLKLHFHKKKGIYNNNLELFL